MSRRSQWARLVRLEDREAPAKPWLVLKPGETAPEVLDAHYGGVIQLQTFDGRKPA